MKRYIAVIISLIGVVSFSSCAPITGYPIGTFSERAKDPQSKCLKKNFMSIWKDKSLPYSARTRMSNIGSPMYGKSTKVLTSETACQGIEAGVGVFDSSLQFFYLNYYKKYGEEVADRYKDAYSSCGVETSFMDIKAKIIPSKRCLWSSSGNADKINNSGSAALKTVKKAAVINNNTKPSQSVIRKSARPTSTSGLSAIIDSPTMPANQALAICKPQAELAANRAASGVQSQNSDIFCNMAGNQVFCNRGGNKWSAIGDHLDRSRAYNQTNRSVLSSCLAQYGWRY